MSIRILRDSANPLGGHAVLSIRGAPAGLTETELRIQRREDDLFLGEHGWEPRGQTLGPFPLEPHEDGVAVRLGPSVVNKMEPFQKLQIDALSAQVSAEVDWPDDIQPLRQTSGPRGVMTPRAGTEQKPVHRGRGVQAGRVPSRQGSEPQPPPIPSPPVPQENETHVQAPAGGDEAGTEDARSGPGGEPEPDPPSPPVTEVEPQKLSEPEPQEPRAPAPQEPPEPEPQEPRAPAPQEPPEPRPGTKGQGGGKSKALWMLLGGGGVVAVAVIAFLAFMPSKELPPEMPKEQVEDSDTEPVEPAAECDVASVSGEGDDTQWKMAETCIAQDDNVGALSLIERLAANDYGQAQLQLAKWLDPEQLGVSPMEPRNANTAVRLYAKAREAGLDEAEPLLQRLCASLEGIDDLNAQMTVKTYCGSE